MEIKIIGTPKEIADLVREVQSQPVFSSMITLDGKNIAESSKCAMPSPNYEDDAKYIMPPLRPGGSVAWGESPTAICKSPTAIGTHHVAK